jgi:hypothetical protein
MELIQRRGPLASLLSLACPLPGADHATVSSRDGQFRASVPLEWLLRGRLVEGRLVIPGAPTRCWLVRDVVSIELTVGPRPDSVPSTDCPGSRPGGTAGEG